MNPEESTYIAWDNETFNVLVVVVHYVNCEPIKFMLQIGT